MFMREILRAPRLVLVSLSLWLAACSQSLTVEPEFVSLRVEEDGVRRVRQDLTAEIHHLEGPVYVAVEYTGDGLDEVSANISDNPISLNAWFKPPSSLGPGTYTDVILIAVCEDENCNRHIEGSPKLVPVTYTVGTPLHAKPKALSFTRVQGSSKFPEPVSVSVEGPSLPWEASASPSWLQLPGKTSGTTRELLDVHVETSGLEVGTHTGTVSLTNRRSGEVTGVPVTLQVVAPTLTAAPSSLSFGGPDARSLPGQQLTLSLDTGDNAYGWTVEIDTGSGPRWLKLSSTSGTTSSSVTPLTVSVDAAGLQSGKSYQGSLKFTASAAGHTVTRNVPVSLTLPPHTLWVAGNGVALVSTPSVSRLTHTFTLKDSWGPDSSTPWTALSSQPWLTVTPSGSGGGELTLTANPEGLTADALHLATVTLSSSDSSVLRSEVLQVGLWVGTQPSTTSEPFFFSPLSDWATDPIRPYVYLHDGKNLSVYNIYTARLVTRLTGLGNYLGSMTVSHDGSTLYVLDANIPRRILPVDLNTLTVGSPWSPSTESPQQILYVRPDGHGLLVTPEGQFYEPATGTEVPLVGTFLPNNPDVRLVRASLDGSQICTSNSSVVYCYSPRYSEQGSGSLTLTRRNQNPVGTGYAVYQFAINHDGSRIYIPGGRDYGVAVFDGQTLRELTVLPTPHLENFQVDVDNRFYGRSFERNVAVYDNAGTFLGSYSVPGGVVTFKVSGDGKRFVVLNEYGLRFTTWP